MGVKARRLAAALALVAAALPSGCLAPPDGGAPRSVFATADAFGLEPAWRSSAPAPAVSPPPPRPAAGAQRAAAGVPEAALAARRPRPPAPRIVPATETKRNAFHAHGLVVGVPQAGVYAVEGRALSAQQLERRLRDAARADPATVVIIRPSPGVPQSAVQRAADLGGAAGLHCLPFPAR